jgi:hypothetical protein
MMTDDPMNDRAEYDKPARYKVKSQAEIHVTWRYKHAKKPEAIYTGVEPTVTRHLTSEEQGVEPDFPEEERDFLRIYPDGSMSLEDGEMLTYSAPSRKGETQRIKNLVARIDASY